MTFGIYVEKENDDYLRALNEGGDWITIEADSREEADKLVQDIEFLGFPKEYLFEKYRLIHLGIEYGTNYKSI